MNNGLYGFPPGKYVTVDKQEFERTGIWNKPPNAKFCIIDGCGGGEAGVTGGVSLSGDGGAAGVAYQIIISASDLNQQETVAIGAGGATSGAAGGNTVFSIYTWFGGDLVGVGRYGYLGTTVSSGFGCGVQNAGTSGRVGGFGSGGGGCGGDSVATSGGAGGKARIFEFGSSGSVNANTGGGAPGGSLTVGFNGSDASVLNDRYGFGEGAGGGGYNSSGTGGRGGTGRRGSGGGGGGSGTTGGSFGRGGDGFLRIMTYCWEG
jgi:hypothetical protein